MKNSVYCFIVATSLIAHAKATIVVSPGNLATAEGNANNGLPFSAFENATSFRYQQVFGSTDFASFAEPEFITQIAFRPDAQTGFAFSATLPSIEIHLSTTRNGPDGLSTTFASNVGADAHLVFTGALPLFSANSGPANGPKDFDIVINLQVPFLFDPAQGNLLLEVKNFSLLRISQLDAQGTSGDTVSRLFSTTDAYSTNGDQQTLGLVARFTSSLIPEPAIPLQITAVAAFLFFRRARGYFW